MDLKKRAVHGLIYFVLIALLLLCIFPFYIMIINATHATSELYVGLQIFPGSSFLDNFNNMISRVNIGRGFFNSFIVAASSTVLAAYFGTMTAFGLFEYKFKLKKTVYAILMISMMIPGQLGIIGLFRLCRELKILDTYWPIILPSIANAGTIFFIYQFLETTMDEALLDSARIDGCSEVQIFHRFILPLAKPGIATMIIFNFVSYWNNFFTPMILLFSEEKFTVPILMNNMNSGMLQDLGAKYTAIAISIVPIIVLYCFFSKFITNGMMAGAVKG
jgi:multiple sugar transport system permease protein